MRIFHFYPSGFSLLEVLLSTALFLLLFLFTMSIFQASKKQNSLQRAGMESQSAAALSLDKIQTEASHAGLGLSRAIDLDLVSGIEISEGILAVQSGTLSMTPPNDLFPGQIWIALENTSPFKKGRVICLLNEDQGEAKTLLRVEKDGFELDSSLSFTYRKDKTSLIAVETIMFYLEDHSGILRRKVNNSPAQPLCHETETFECNYDPFNNLLSLKMKMRNKKERVYERCFFPKNMAPHRWAETEKIP